MGLFGILYTDIQRYSARVQVLAPHKRAGAAWTELEQSRLAVSTLRYDKHSS